MSTTEYISNADYKRQKTALTRAINSRVPEQVLVACERVLDQWRGKAWPDDWHRWSIALYDAWLAYERGADWNGGREYVTEIHPDVVARFRDAYERFA